MVRVDEASDNPRYDVSFESSWFGDAHSVLDIDTRGRSARLALGPGEANEWRFSLDGPGTARTSSLEDETPEK